MTDTIMFPSTYTMMIDEIKKLYSSTFDAWVNKQIKPISCTYHANQLPFAYFHSNERLQALYVMSTEWIANNCLIGAMVNHLTELYSCCKESGRMLYFSQTILALNLKPETKKMVALAFVVGMLLGHFNTDLFCEVCYLDGDEKITAERHAMEKVMEDTGCTAVMLVIDARYEKMLHDFHIFHHIKKFAKDGYYSPFHVGIQNVGSTELAEEIEYMLAFNEKQSTMANVVIPIWHRLIESLTDDERELIG